MEALRILGVHLLIFAVFMLPTAAAIWYVFNELKDRKRTKLMRDRYRAFMEDDTLEWLDRMERRHRRWPVDENGFLIGVEMVVNPNPVYIYCLDEPRQPKHNWQKEGF